MAERVRREGWEMVLLTELRADEEGVVWLGVVLIQGKKAGLMLRGEALENVGGRGAAEVVWGEGGSSGG